MENPQHNSKDARQAWKLGWILACWPLVDYMSRFVLKPFLRNRLPLQLQPASDSLLWFVQKDFIAGFCALITLILCVIIGMATWRRFRPFSYMLVVLPVVGNYQDVARTLMIWSKCGNVFSRNFSVETWSDHGAYISATQMPQYLFFPISLFVFVVVAIAVRSHFRNLS